MNAILRFAMVVGIVTWACMPSYGQERAGADSEVTKLDERVVPMPAGLSPEMQDVVRKRGFPSVFPAPKTTEQWLKLQAAFDKPGDELGRQGVEYNHAKYEVEEIAGVRVYLVTPEEINERFSDCIFVHTHGGAWVFGGGDSALREAVWVATGVGVRVVSIDYRRPPLHPFPAAIEDAVAVWREVIKKQDNAKMIHLIIHQISILS